MVRGQLLCLVLILTQCPRPVPGPHLEQGHVKSRSNDVMQRKRKVHAAAITAERQKRDWKTHEDEAEAKIARRSAEEQDKGAAGPAGSRMQQRSSGDGGQGSSSGDDELDGAGREEGGSQLHAAREAAAKAVEFGDGVLSEGRFRCARHPVPCLSLDGIHGWHCLQRQAAVCQPHARCKRKCSSDLPGERSFMQ
jgi:hypothetical protein